MKLITGWRQSWRLWSVRLSALGSLLMLVALAAPDMLLATWNTLPPETRELIPDDIAQAVAAVLFAATIVARLVQQRSASDGE
jgi:hypothetical protein